MRVWKIMKRWSNLEGREQINVGITKVNSPPIDPYRLPIGVFTEAEAETEAETDVDVMYKGKREK